MLVTCKWFGPLETFHQIKLRIELDGDLMKWQEWEPKMQPWQVLHSKNMWRWGAWMPRLTEALHLKDEGLIPCGDKGACTIWPWGYWRPALGGIGLFICPSAWLWPCWHLRQTYPWQGLLTFPPRLPLHRPSVVGLPFGDALGTQQWTITDGRWDGGEVLKVAKTSGIHQMWSEGN